MNLSRRIVLTGVAAVLGLTAGSAAQERNPYRAIGGQVKESITLKKGQTPYVLTDDLIVARGAVLTIEPGATIYGNDSLYAHHAIIVDGTLDAQGTETDGIRFDCQPGTWHWRGIILREGSVGILSHCHIANASIAVECKDPQVVSIENCLIEAELNGIELLCGSAPAGEDCNVVFIKETTIRNCWIGILTQSPAETTIDNSIFEASNKIAISCRQKSCPVIRGSEFHAPLTSSSSEPINATGNYWTKSVFDLMKNGRARCPLVDYSGHMIINKQRESEK